MMVLFFSLRRRDQPYFGENFIYSPFFSSPLSCRRAPPPRFCASQFPGQPVHELFPRRCRWTERCVNILFGWLNGYADECVGNIHLAASGLEIQISGILKQVRAEWGASIFICESVPHYEVTLWLRGRLVCVLRGSTWSRLTAYECVGHRFV